MNRRAYLVGAAIAFAGTPAAARAATDDDATETPSSEETETVRGTANVDLAVEEHEDDEHVAYLEEEDEVRYVMAWRTSAPRVRNDSAPATDDPPEREPVYETISWERWGKLRGRSAAAPVAAEHVADELEIEEDRVGHALSSRVPGDDSGAVVTVSDPDDELELTVEELAAVTPATVDVTYVLDGREFEYEAPIFARIDRYRMQPAAIEVADTAELDGEGVDDPADGDPEEGQTDDADGSGDDRLEEGGAEEDDRAETAADDDTVPGFGPFAAVGGIGTVLLAHWLGRAGDERSDGGS